MPASTHRAALGHDSEPGVNPGGSDGAAVHAPAPGSVDVTTCPDPSTATHSAADGQEIAVTGWSKPTEVRDHAPAAGSVLL